MLVYQRVITNYNHQYYFFSLTSGDGQPPGGPRRLLRLVEGFRQAKDLSFFSHFVVGNSGFATEKTWDIHHPAQLVRGCTRCLKKQLNGDLSKMQAAKVGYSQTYVYRPKHWHLYQWEMEILGLGHIHNCD